MNGNVILNEMTELARLPLMVTTINVYLFNTNIERGPNRILFDFDTCHCS